MTRFAQVAANMLVIAVASTTVLVSSRAVAQSQFGTADEARAMLLKAVAAVKADKAKAIDVFNKGAGGFLDRDLYPFCTNASDGKFVALNSQRELLGQDIRRLTDVGGQAFGLAQFAAAQKPEGQITEVSYLVPNSGAHTTPLLKASFTTRAGDLVCGVTYYPMATFWSVENPSF